MVYHQFSGKPIQDDIHVLHQTVQQQIRKLQKQKPDHYAKCGIACVRICKGIEQLALICTFSTGMISLNSAINIIRNRIHGLVFQTSLKTYSSLEKKPEISVRRYAGTSFMPFGLGGLFISKIGPGGGPIPYGAIVQSTSFHKANSSA